MSTRDGLETIQRWRGLGVGVTCEVTPHHCLLTAEDAVSLGAMSRVNPPLREHGHGEALLDGLADGRIQAIATDHAPHAREKKVGADIWSVASGFPGVETSLRLFLTHTVGTGRLTLEQLVHATSEGPARTWSLWPRKGAITVGSDADLTIVDLHAEGAIRAGELHGKSDITPFEGHKTLGAAVAASGRPCRRCHTDPGSRDAATRHGEGRPSCPDPVPAPLWPCLSRWQDSCSSRLPRCRATDSRPRSRSTRRPRTVVFI